MICLCDLAPNTNGGVWIVDPGGAPGLGSGTHPPGHLKISASYCNEVMLKSERSDTKVIPSDSSCNMVEWGIPI